MIDWLDVSRACVRDLDSVLADLPTRVEREPVLSAGKGGDDTTAIDAAAESAVVRRLQALGTDLTLVSEEIGRVGRDATGHLPILDPDTNEPTTLTVAWQHVAAAVVLGSEGHAADDDAESSGRYR